MTAAPGSAVRRGGHRALLRPLHLRPHRSAAPGRADLGVALLRGAARSPRTPTPFPDTTLFRSSDNPPVLAQPDGGSCSWSVAASNLPRRERGHIAPRG